MKKLLYGFLLIFVLVLGACGSDTDDAEAAEGGDGEVIKVGYIGAL